MSYQLSLLFSELNCSNAEASTHFSQDVDAILSTDSDHDSFASGLTDIGHGGHWLPVPEISVNPVFEGYNLYAMPQTAYGSQDCKTLSMIQQAQDLSLWDISAYGIPPHTSDVLAYDQGICTEPSMLLSTDLEQMAQGISLEDLFVTETLTPSSLPTEESFAQSPANTMDMSTLLDVLSDEDDVSDLSSRSCTGSPSPSYRRTAAYTPSPSPTHRRPAPYTIAHPKRTKCRASSSSRSPSSSPSPPSPRSRKARTRNVQAVNRTLDELFGEAAMNGWTACPFCRFSPLSGRETDLRRHILTHCPHSEFVCRGVPFEQASEFGITNTEDWYFVDGVKMIGGCGASFSRQDALQRHWRKSKMGCLSDTAIAKIRGAN